VYSITRDISSYYIRKCAKSWPGWYNTAQSLLASQNERADSNTGYAVPQLLPLNCVLACPEGKKNWV
jgi:hypothetical protein